MMRNLDRMKTELIYQIRSYILIGITIAGIALMSISLVSNCNQVGNAYRTYQQTLKYSQEMGEDIEAALAEDYTVTTEMVNGVKQEYIENSLKYYQESVTKANLVASPRYAITQILEICTFLYFPLIFSILGICVATYDRKYRTLRVKAVRSTKTQIHRTKLAALFAGVTASFITIILACCLIAYILYITIVNGVPLNEFPPSDSIQVLPLLPKVIFSLGVSFLFALVGYTLGLIFRGALIPVIIMAAYTFLIPNMGKYDLKNILLGIGNKVFDYYGMFRANQPIEISAAGIIIACVMFLMVIIVSSSLLARKRSAYQC